MLKSVVIRAKSNRPLNAVVDYVEDHAPELIEAFEEFSLIIGQTQALGSGDPPILEIRIKAIISNPDESEADDIDRILELLSKCAKKLDMELSFDFTENTAIS